MISRWRGTQVIYVEESKGRGLVARVRMYYWSWSASTKEG